MKVAHQSLDEELELYKLLDLDAPGEEDINVEIDNALFFFFLNPIYSLLWQAICERLNMYKR